MFLTRPVAVVLMLMTFFHHRASRCWLRAGKVTPP